MDENKKQSDLEDQQTDQNSSEPEEASQPSESEGFYADDDPSQDSAESAVPENELVQQLVLLVDDEPDMLEILDIAMRNIGFETILANNGAEAWDLYKKHRPALVISDIYMPKKNGIILLSQIKESNEKTVVILITGKLFNASWRYKPDAFLTKPFNLSDLVNCIDSAVSRQNRKKS